ncbi:MAG: glycosyltransferase [Bacteroidota bacterium]
MEAGVKVYIASDGRALELLKKEFPSLPFFELPGYGVKYRSSNMVLNMMTVAPKLLNAIFNEFFLIKKIIKENDINAIVSDNRLGCFSKKIPSVFVTHQIDLRLPNKLFQFVARRINYFFLGKYDRCWIPDVEGLPNLSGCLSHGFLIKKKTYIGGLSRMKKKKVPNRYKAIAVLSGPEPQRSNLEKIIIGQAKETAHNFLIVLGKTEKEEHFLMEKNIEIKSFLTSEELNKAILASDVYIGRSGYSSIMDLIKLNKPALLIPTPGQTEQEYLCEHLSENDFFCFQKQEEINLEKGIIEALNKKGVKNNYFTEKKIEAAINELLNLCE